MEPLFVDTGAWIALEVANDRHHEAARAFARGPGRHYRWLTTNWVVAETVTLLRRHAGHGPAVRFGENIRASGLLELVRVDAIHEDRAWEIFQGYADKSFGMVDCVSFAVMEAQAADTAFSFDRHFRQFGWVVLPETT